jgi:hypothetical protein
LGGARIQFQNSVIWRLPPVIPLFDRFTENWRIITPSLGAKAEQNDKSAHGTDFAVVG